MFGEHMHVGHQDQQGGMPILIDFISFFLYVDGNNGWRHVAFIEMVILAGGHNHFFVGHQVGAYDS